MRVIFLSLLSIFLVLCLLLLITDRGVLISEKKIEDGYVLSCKYFSGRNTFNINWWTSKGVVTLDKQRDYCPFISKP